MASREETQSAVAAGKCPKCGLKIKRNFSMKGWWQCQQFGNPVFRANPDQAPCSWQGFTS